MNLEEALKRNAIEKEKWLYEELVKGLKLVGVEVWLEEEPNKLETPFNTILHIETKTSKYSAGLKQKISTKERDG